MSKRVVITGTGVVTPFGYGMSALKKGLDEGKNSVKIMEEFKTIKGLKSFIGAPVEICNEKNIPRTFRRYMSRMSIMAVQAAEEAITMTGMDKATLGSGKAGCIIGSTTGSPAAIQEAFEKIISDNSIEGLTSMSFFKGMSHSAAANVAQYFGITGTVMATNAACASSLQAVCAGYDLIKSGRQEIVVCGGAEELHPATTASFDILEATSINFLGCPSKTPRPFDQARDGLVCGEGAGILVLEDYEHAKNRGAKIISELAGCYTNTSNVPVTQSDRESLAACMKGALSNAGIPPSAVDYINAHATGTVHGDKAEAHAIYDVFGPKVPVSSLKGYIAHTLGASGTIETSASILMMQNNLIYPGLNLDKIADDCFIINLLREKKETNLNCILKNAFAFGGINVSIVFRRFNE